MMTQDRDYEDALRRALTAAAESIEPAGDGLQRIRHRLDSPRSPRSVLSACTEWLELRGTRFLIRLEPVTEAGRTALRRSGPLAALFSFLRGLLSPRAAGPSRRASRGSSWLTRPPGAGRTLAQAGVRGLGGGGHRRGRRGHPQPRDGDPHQADVRRHQAHQPGLQPGHRGGGEVQAVDAAARGQSHPAVQRPGAGQERAQRAARGGLHPYAVAESDRHGAGRERDGDPDPVPERRRDQPARDTPAEPTAAFRAPPRRPAPPPASTGHQRHGTTAVRTTAVRTAPTAVLSVDAGGPIVECGTGTGSKS